MKRKYRNLSICLLILCLLFAMTVPVSAAKIKGVTAASKEVKKGKAGWIEKRGKVYWQNENGTLRKKPGRFRVKNGTYYLNKDGSRLCKSFKKLKGRYYYFRLHGKMFCPEKKTWRTLKGKTYYFYKDGHVATGRTKIGKKYYYFDSKGALLKNISAVKSGKKYYRVNENGVMKSISETKAKCSLAARSYIAKHSNSSQTNAQKFRSCFNYLLGYMRYSPGYFSMSADYRIIDRKEGAYELALSTFNSPVLRGNCHRFACCIAAIAKELGYKDPTVIATTGDHSFVIINGGYYDNMYGGLFGAASRPAYRVYKRTVF